MDFKWTEPKHWIPLLFLLVSLLLFTILPIIGYFGIGGTSDVELPDFSDNSLLVFLFQVILLGVELVLVFLFFILGPILWYLLVNNCRFKEIFERIQLRKSNLTEAVLWAIIAVVLAFTIIIAIDLVLIALGYDLTDVSNITQLESLFSLPLIIVLIIIQPIAEEIFYRGFLLDKLTTYKGPWFALIITSILFGAAHLLYYNIYPAVLSAIAGMVFGFVVIKTKNLTTGIIAHISFNVISFSFYLIGTELMP